MSKVRLILMICFFSGACFANKYQEAFLKANNLYAQKNYKEALDLYKSIDSKGAATWFNMGNCAYKLGDYVDAIIFFQKAKKTANSFVQYEDINYNMSAAYNRLGLAEKATVLTYVYDLFNLCSLFVLQILFLLFWFGFFVSYIFIKRLRILTLSIMICFSFVLSVAIFCKYRTITYPLAIVKSSVSIFSGPNEKYHEIAKLSIADKVVVQKIDKNWYKIKSNGVSGWVSAENIEII